VYVSQIPTNSTLLVLLTFYRIKLLIMLATYILFLSVRDTSQLFSVVSAAQFFNLPIRQEQYFPLKIPHSVIMGKIYTTLHLYFNEL